MKIKKKSNENNEPYQALKSHKLIVVATRMICIMKVKYDKKDAILKYGYGWFPVTETEIPLHLHLYNLPILDLERVNGSLDKLN